MRPRHLVFITLMALCHLHLYAQALTNGVPPEVLPDEPGQQILPVAVPEPTTPVGQPVRWQARTQTRDGDLWTLDGDVTFFYGDYTVHAPHVVLHQQTQVVEITGPLTVEGGSDDMHLSAASGELHLRERSGRFFDVHGSAGIRQAGRTVVYSTTNPFLFSGRVLISDRPGHYRIVDGTMTNCHLPHPDWQLLSKQIALDDGIASSRNTVFKLFGVPVFDLPFVRHPIDQTGRQSGFLVPVISNSSTKGFVIGEQFYWVISRNMDMVIGSELYSRRGWAPNGDFRYKGDGLNNVSVRWNALLDRGLTTNPASSGRSNQGGVDVSADGRRDLGRETYVAGTVEYLSNYVYRLVFNDNYSQAISSEVISHIAATNVHNGLVASILASRFESFASAIKGDEVRLIHSPSLRYDVVDRPLGSSPFYFGLSSSMDYLNRSEPHFHARNLGRFDLYPHLSLPLHGGGWSLLASVAARDTFYSSSQRPDLKGTNSGIPTLRHELVNRNDLEANVDIRPPAVERDFHFGQGTLRHVIEPQLTYHFVGGIGDKALNIIHVDTSDIATDTNEVGFQLTQRFYLRQTGSVACVPDAGADSQRCPAPARPWASWQIGQRYFLNPSFGGSLITDRRNVNDSTLDLSGVSFLTGGRNLSPITSRLRFEAINHLRVEWDLDYDSRLGHAGADNLYAGYEHGDFTLGIGHALLNAVDENGSKASTIQSQQIQPFFYFGKPNRVGFNVAAHAGYDFVLGQTQYAGVQATYNWDCCGLTVGYRRYELGSVRDETQWLYSFTIANFGSVGDVRRSTTVFRDPALPPAF